jgi:hypothetical protein
MGLLRGLDFKRVGPGARGASEIFEYDHRDLAAGGRPEDRRVVKIVVRAGSKELGFQREWAQEQGQTYSSCDQETPHRYLRSTGIVHLK